jgi:putative membrane protein
VRTILQVITNAVGVWVASQIIPGIVYHGDILNLLLAGLVIGLINLLVKPIVSFFSFPLILLTLGLFYLLINGFLFWLAAQLLSGLTVQGCVPAILGGLIIAAVNWLFRAFTKD